MKKIILALIGCVSLTTCNVDVLNLKNPAQYDEVSYYKTQKECQEVIAACYSVLTMRPFYARDWYFIFDLLTGQAITTTNADTDLSQLEAYTFLPQHIYIGDAWLGFYRLSLRSLVAIEKLSAWETSSDSEAAYKELMLGEAYFFHGYAYYFLTEIWGDVPYHDTWESIKEEPAKARTPYGEVQTKIEQALTTALSKLPESWDDKYLGRVTKDAARAMLGKLYLTMGDNDKAINAFESIRASQYHPDYYRLFTRGNHTSKEIILQVLHMFYGWDSGNSYHMFGGTETWGGTATNCGRHMEYGFDWNNVSVAHKAAGKFRYQLNGQEYIDPRNQFIMYGNGIIGDNDYADNAEETDVDGPGKGGPGPIPFTWVDAEGTLTGYKYKKYNLHEDYEHVWIELGDYSSILIRVADVKLMLAEAYIGKGNYDKAKSLINEVRTREAVQAEPYNDLNASNAFDILKLERYIELFGENHFWFDLVRWDRLGKLNMITELNSLVKGSPVQPKHKKFPIPTQEKDTNPNMVIQADNWN